MSTSTWTGAVSSVWDDPDNWSPAGVPGVDSDVTIVTGAPVASASIGTVNSITDSSDLSFESAGTNAVTAFLDNTGALNVDDSAGAGGTVLNIGGTLTNGGSFSIGNTALSTSDEVTAAALDNINSTLQLFGSGANQALLDVTGSAGFGTTGLLRGYVQLVGDSAIEFVSGEITSLAANTKLHLNGNDAFIEDSSAPGSNSALTGLARIGAGAIFGLRNHAAVSTTGALDNKGYIRLDFVRGDGGSSLTLAGALTNSGYLDIGNSALVSPSKVSATALTNTGSIDLTGSGADQALLDVSGAVGFGIAGLLSGNVDLSGDSAVEFKSGQITSLSDGAQLGLVGNDAFIEDSSAPGSNSALTGLARIGAGAGLVLQSGASVSTSGALVNNGSILLDFDGGEGGSSLTVGGALGGGGHVFIGYDGISASDTVTASSLHAGVTLTGSSANQALLDVTGGAGFGTAGVADYVRLAGDSAVEFASGQITSLSENGLFLLDGNDAFIEDSSSPGSNSALTGLASIGFGAIFDLENGAAVSTTGALANDSGWVYLDTDPGDGGSSLTVGGALTTGESLQIGNSTLSASDNLTAASLDNTSLISLTGHGTNFATLDVSGATTNNGGISITDDTEGLAGPVGGKGRFSLSHANLQFDSSVSAGQTIDEAGKDALILEEAQSFAGRIKGFGTGDFGTGDTIDATNFLKTATTYNFVENLMGTGGKLTLTDTSQSLTANILMTGVYSNSDFTLAPDSGTGTLVKFV